MDERPNLCLISPEPLILTEQVDDGRVSEIEAELPSERRWKFPILVHSEGGFVMVGHHRVTVARRLSLAALPAVFLDDDLVDVEAWRDGETITPEMIPATARGGGRFPSKTTRHRPKVELPPCDIPLSRLTTPEARWRPRPNRHLLSYR